MINFKEVPNGETWELFARDFLMTLGFFIESAPDRGADGGKDMLVTEQLSGALGNYKMKWLVSAKHFATSNKSVSEDHEPNILERVRGFQADGFIGVYSTVPSTGLNGRLTQLRESGNIKDFRIFDHRLIENYLIRVGYSILLMRYFPDSYRAIRPLHEFYGEYVPLRCVACGKDLLESLYETSYNGLVSYWQSFEVETDAVETIKEITFACKGDHDFSQQAGFKARGLYATWEDISDLVIPAGFLRFIFSTMNNLRSGDMRFTDHAYEQFKTFIMALAQKALRENTVEEQQRVQDLVNSEWLIV